MIYKQKYRLIVTRLAIWSLLTLLSSASQAGSATLDLTFLKRPPRIGIFYAVESEASGKNAEIDQIAKKFTSTINVADTTGELVFDNSDSVDHNIYANDTRNQVQFDIGLMSPGHKVNIPLNWKEDTLVRIGCKIHPKMRTYVANINSASYSILNFKDKNPKHTFTLDNIGSHVKELAVLFPGYDLIKVTINSGQSSTVTVTKKGKEKASATISRQ
ncbi:MAG: hypothetical protein COA42_05820 [Alteromonadaceae bacterium]|nr:MAG: hypothetical protein COA42_05820 [Alteromonadaceae bacterium]